MTAWTLITESEPPNCERVMLWQFGRIVIGTRLQGYLGHPAIWAIEGAGRPVGITHWAPLPEGPK